MVVDNLTTGVGDSVPLSSPSDQDNICGGSAEWIVEDPGPLDSLFPFAKFTTVVMEGCAASTTTGATANLDGAALFIMDQNGVELATPLVDSPSQLRIVSA